MRSSDKPEHPQTEQKLAKLLPCLIVAIIIAVTAAIRFRLLDVPLERDEGEYAYAGQLMLEGVPPYSLVYNMKMPGIYAAYALILAAFGQTCAGIHLGLLIVNAATIVLIFLLAKYLADSWAGVLAAAAFAVMSLTLPVEGLFANAEHFAILFAIAGLLFLLYAIDRNKPIALLASAILFGLGFLMKQHAVAFVVFAGLYLLFSLLRRRPFRFIPFVITTGLFAVGAALPFGLTCLLLWRAGVFEKFWFWTFMYAREYVSVVSIRDGLGFLKLRIIWIVGSAIPIWILAAVGLAILFINRKIRYRCPFVLGLLLFSFLATCPAFYFRPHYFILLLPALALLSGVGLSGIRHALEPKMPTVAKNLITVLLALAAPLYTLYHQKNYLFESNPAVVSRMTYGVNHFPAYLEIAEYIKSHSSTDDTIAVLGSEPEIFFYAHRRSAAGYIYFYPLMEPQPYALQMQQEMIRQIEAAQPRFFLIEYTSFNWIARSTSNILTVDWLQQYGRHYHLVGLVDFASDDTEVYHWNGDATRYLSTFLYGVVVLQRNQ